MYKLAFSKMLTNLTEAYNINFAIWAYQYGPNLIRNESFPKGYYIACGKMRFGLAGHCALPEVISILTEIYKCIAYDVVYQPQRTYRPYDIASVERSLKFVILSSVPIIFIVFILGILNFVIMTRVQKHMEGSDSASLLLHQSEIACDVISAWFSIPYYSIVNQLTPFGKASKAIVFLSTLYCTIYGYNSSIFTMY